MDSSLAAIAGVSCGSAGRTPVTALIVDDEAHVRAYVRVAAQSLGIAETWEAADGATALALYRAHAPAVVFLDVNLPSMSGAEILTQLVEIDPNANVIVVTADSAHQTVRRFLELGAVGYVLKQRPPEAFRAALQELLESLVA